MGKLQIDILGTSLSLQAKEDAAYLRKLLSYYKKIVEQLENSMNVQDSLQISILAGLNLCDELYKEKMKSAKLELFSSSEKDSPAKDIAKNVASKEGVSKDAGLQTKWQESISESKKAEEIALTLIDKLDKVLL